MSDFVMFYTTWPTNASAKAAAKELLSQRLIACANILPQATSIYTWADEAKEEDEIIMILKSTHLQIEALSSKIIELHPYDTPAIIEIKTGYIFPEFADWIHQLCK